MIPIFSLFSLASSFYIVIQEKETVRAFTDRGIIHMEWYSFEMNKLSQHNIQMSVIHLLL